MEEQFLFLYGMKKNESHLIQFIADYSELYDRFARQAAQLQKKYEKFPYQTDLSVEGFMKAQAQAFQTAFDTLNELQFRFEKRRKDIHEQVRAYQTTYEKLNKAVKDVNHRLEREKSSTKKVELEQKGKNALEEITTFEQTSTSRVEQLRSLTEMLWSDIPAGLSKSMKEIAEGVGNALQPPDWHVVQLQQTSASQTSITTQKQEASGSQVAATISLKSTGSSSGPKASPAAATVGIGLAPILD